MYTYYISSFMFNKRKNILFLGQRNTGKTSLLYKIFLNKIIKTIPTIGLISEKCKIKDKKINLIEVGCTPDSFHLWHYFYKHANLIIYLTTPLIYDKNLEYSLINNLLSTFTKKILIVINKNGNCNDIIENIDKKHSNFYIISCNIFEQDINSIKNWIYFNI